MSLDPATLTKDQARKLNALRKSLGTEIADDAFVKWMKTQTKEKTVQIDPVAEKIKTLYPHWSMTRHSVWAAKDTISKGRRVRVRLGLQSVRLSRD